MTTDYIPPSPAQLAERNDMTFETDVVNRHYELNVDREARQRQANENLPTFHEESLQDVLMDESSVPFIIPGVLPQGVIGLAGPPEAGKSLLCRDWLDCVANGVPWRGYTPAEVRQCTYVVGEGRSGLKRRFSGVEATNIRVATPVNLTSNTEVDRFLELKKAQEEEDGPHGLIIFDMIYQMGVENEDKSSDVMPAVRNAIRIADELKCCVIVLGHPGHNGDRRFRGSSSFRGLFNAEFHMADSKFTCEKMKDHDDVFVNKDHLGGTYTIIPRNNNAYLSFSTGDMLGSEAEKQKNRELRIRRHFLNHPDLLDSKPNISAIYRELKDDLGLKDNAGRGLIKDVYDKIQEERKNQIII